MARIARDPVTGLKFRYDEASGEFVPFVDADNAVDAALIAAGSQFSRYGRSIREMFGGDRDALAAEQQEADDLLAGLREFRPVATTVGDMLPALATMPLGAGIGGAAAGAGRMLATNVGVGAAEGALSFDPDAANQAGSAATGAAFGLLGDLGGRMAGRVLNAIRGMSSRLGGSQMSEAAQELTRRGLATLPSERANVPGADVTALQRFEQGAKSGFLPARIFSATEDQRQELVNKSVRDAIGLGGLGKLEPGDLLQAENALIEEFQEVALQTYQDGLPRVFNISDPVRDMLQDTKGQIARLQRMGDFRGLDEGMLAGQEMMVARRALAQDAANAMDRGDGVLGEKLYEGVDELDRVFAAQVNDPALLPRWERAREQYRNLQIVQKGGVINNSGDVSARTLQNRLRQGTGYGRRAALGDTAGLQDETAEMLDVARLLSAPELQPFRSSGTAENQALRDATQQAAQVGSALASGDPAGLAAGLIGSSGLFAGPLLDRMAGGNVLPGFFGGLYQQAGFLPVRAGGTLGASGLIEDLLFNEANQ